MNNIVKLNNFSGFRIVSDFGKFNCINKTNKCNFEDVHYLETICCFIESKTLLNNQNLLKRFRNQQGRVHDIIDHFSLNQINCNYYQHFNFN